MVSGGARYCFIILPFLLLLLLIPLARFVHNFYQNNYNLGNYLGNGNVLVYVAGTWRESLGDYRREVEEGASCTTPHLPAPMGEPSWRTSNKQPPNR